MRSRRLFVHALNTSGVLPFSQYTGHDALGRRVHGLRS